MTEIDYVHHDSVTYGNGFAIKSEVDFANGTGKIIAVRVKTNADRIRSMSDEELADFIGHKPTIEWCSADKDCTWDDDCKDCVLVWLRKEA